MNVSNLLSLIAGAFLAILGGAFVEWLRIKMERKQELDCIKISLKDELDEIKINIDNLREFWNKSGVAHKAYIEDLSKNTSAYENYRSRLFLFKDSDLRRKITIFYKKLKKMVQESMEKAGTLEDTPDAKNEQEKIKNDFVSLGAEAQEIKNELN